MKTTRKTEFSKVKLSWPRRTGQQHATFQENYR